VLYLEAAAAASLLPSQHHALMPSMWGQVGCLDGEALRKTHQAPAANIPAVCRLSSRGAMLQLASVGCSSRAVSQ
jgi:hypothetical protein